MMRSAGDLARIVTLACEAGVLLTVAHVLTRRVAYRRWSRLLGTAGSVGAAIGAEGDCVRATRIGRIIDRVADRHPWRPVCLPRAMCARWMLNRRGVVNTMFVGVEPDAGAGEARMLHAWLEVGGVTVTGRITDRDIRPIARFGGAA